MPTFVPDRRRQRSNDVQQALGLQLQACLEDAHLDAMILSDDTGLCMAASGEEQTCGEIAAAAPIIGRNAGDFAGVLLGDRRGLEMNIQRFRLDEAILYMCAVGGSDDLRARQIARSIRGCARILAV